MAQLQPTNLSPEEELEGLDHLDGDEGGDDKKSMFGKMKNKAKRYKAKVKKNYKTGHGESGEEEEIEEHQDETPEKSDKNVDDVTKDLAGLDAFGTQDTDSKDGHIIISSSSSSEDEMPLKAIKNPNDEFLSHAEETQPASNDDNVKDSLIEGECKGTENEGTQKQQSEAEAKTVQSSYAQKLYAAKNAIASKLGYGGQTNQESNVIEASKPGQQSQGPKIGTGPVDAMEGSKENKQNFKSTIVAKLSPGEDEIALSEVITGAVSNSARSVKDTVLGGFSKGNTKSEVTSSSTTDAATEASPGSKQVLSKPSQGKGFVGSVTGVVNSFFGKKQDEDEAIGEVKREEDLEIVPKPEMQPTGKSEGQTGESILTEESGKRSEELK